MTDARRQQATGIAAAAGLIAVATLAARIVGFGRWVVFSGSVGGTCVGEAYATANQLPNVLFEVAAGGALAAIVVPLVGRALAAGDRERADHIASALLTWALLVLLPAAVLLGLVAGPLTSALLGDGACGGAGQTDLARRMLVVFAPQVPLYAVAIILGGVLQAHRRFLAAAIAPLLSSLVVIAAYVIYGTLVNGAGNNPADLPQGAEWALSGGTTLGVVALSLPLLLPIARAGVRLRPTLHFPPGTARTAGHLAGAGVLALLAQQGAVLATVWVANHSGDQGAFNVYTYLQAVYLLPYAVLAVPLATAAFPSLVHADDTASSEVPRPLLTRSLRTVLAAGALGAAVLIAAAPAIGGFFTYLDAGRDSATRGSLTALDSALTAYAPGLWGLAAVALLQRAAYARGASWAAGLAVAAGWVLAGAVPLALLRGEVGSERTLQVLGWSSSIGMLVSAALLTVVVARAWGAATVTTAARSAAVSLIAAALAATVGRLSVHVASVGSLTQAIVIGVIAGVVTVAVFVVVVRAADPHVLRRSTPADVGQDA